MEVLHLDVDENTLRLGPISGPGLADLRSTLQYWYRDDMYGVCLTWMYKDGYMYISNYRGDIARALKRFGCKISKLMWA